MALIYVKGMTNAQLDEWVARAQDECLDPIVGLDHVWAGPASGFTCVEGYKPTEKWSQCGPLIEKFQIEAGRRISGDGYWATCEWEGANKASIYYYYGTIPQEAICRAVVAAVYGEYVEVDDE